MLFLFAKHKTDARECRRVTEGGTERRGRDSMEQCWAASRGRSNGKTTIKIFQAPTQLGTGVFAAGSWLTACRGRRFFRIVRSRVVDAAMHEGDFRVIGTNCDYSPCCHEPLSTEGGQGGAALCTPHFRCSQSCSCCGRYWSCVSFPKIFIITFSKGSIVYRRCPWRCRIGQLSFDRQAIFITCQLVQQLQQQLQLLWQVLAFQVNSKQSQQQ